MVGADVCSRYGGLDASILFWRSCLSKCPNLGKLATNAFQATCIVENVVLDEWTQTCPLVQVAFVASTTVPWQCLCQLGAQGTPMIGRWKVEHADKMAHATG